MIEHLLEEAKKLIGLSEKQRSEKQRDEYRRKHEELKKAQESFDRQQTDLAQENEV